MRILRGVYEGPGSHGILRAASSMEGVHGVLRALPNEGYFHAVYGAWTRSGEPPPVTLSPVWDRSRLPEGSTAPGHLGRDLSGIVRRHPETEAVILARSEAALLSGEELPVTSLPQNPETGRMPALITCGWESPEVREFEAADLALEEIVRAHARPRDKSPAPTVNLFGPPVFSPGARAEYDEAERLLGLLGVGVNVRVPLGTDVGELERLGRAWASVVLYREIGESATLFLQDEFGVPRVTTPMIGSAGTGAVLRAVGHHCKLNPNKVRQVAWGELARTTKLPWFARLAPPETFQGRRVALFGDLTYTLGLGYALAREVGLEVAPCGTYLTHLERDFVFHAHTFTEDAFVADDPDEVADRIEASSPDLVVGTHLEEEVAAALGVPFLPLCPPVVAHPFVERSLMGYAGSSALADALDGALRREEKEQEPAPPGPPWTDEALEGLEEIPAFLRGRARRLAEERARELDAPEVTPEILDEARG
jgi:light-independent protochlorophyllide reductase subunit B